MRDQSLLTLSDMAPKVMIFTGAPANDAIDWASEELLNDFLEPLARFSGTYKAPGTNANTEAEETVLDIATWRSIPLQQQRLQTGFTQVHEFVGYYQASQDFFSTADTQDTDAASQSLREEFYEHSLRVYDDITSSQLPTATLNSTAEETSFISTQDESFRSSIKESTFIDQGDRTLGLGTARLSNLGDLPNASYLNSIEPQTMTVNLIAGVISVAEPRTVRTKWGRSKSLVELIIGDESKSGFSITFWLSDDAISASEAIPHTQQPLKTALNNAFDKSDSARTVDPHLIAQITAEVKKSVLDEIKLTAMGGGNTGQTPPHQAFPSSTAQTPPRNVYTPPSPNRQDFSARDFSSPDPPSFQPTVPTFDGNDDTPPLRGPQSAPVEIPRARMPPRPAPARMATEETYTPIEKMWQRLFDVQGQPTARLGQFLRGLAVHLVRSDAG